MSLFDFFHFLPTSCVASLLSGWLEADGGWQRQGSQITIILYCFCFCARATIILYCFYSTSTSTNMSISRDKALRSLSFSIAFAFAPGPPLFSIASTAPAPPPTCPSPGTRPSDHFHSLLLLLLHQGQDCSRYCLCNTWSSTSINMSITRDKVLRSPSFSIAFVFAPGPKTSDRSLYCLCNTWSSTSINFFITKSPALQTALKLPSNGPIPPIVFCKASFINFVFILCEFHSSNSSHSNSQKGAL